MGGLQTFQLETNTLERNSIAKCNSSLAMVIYCPAFTCWLTLSVPSLISFLWHSAFTCHVSLPFILADVDVEAVKGEMPWQRSLSRCRNQEGKVITLIYFLRYMLWGHQSCLSLMRSQADMVLYQQDMRSQVVHGGLGHRRRMRICQGGNRAVRGWPCLIKSKNIKWAFWGACYTFL